MPLPCEPELMPTFPQHRLYKKKLSNNDNDKYDYVSKNKNQITSYSKTKEYYNKNNEYNEIIHKKQKHKD